MRRTALLLVAALCLAVPASRTIAPALALGRPAATRFQHPRDDRGGCKPGAPLAVELAQVGAHDGSVVELSFSIMAHVACEAASWRLDLPAGARVLDGASAGTLEAGVGSSGPMHASVQLPPDADFTRIALTVEGSFATGTDTSAASRTGAGSQLEPVQSRRTLSWGRPPLAVPERQRIDPDSGAVERLAALAVRHRPGR